MREWGCWIIWRLCRYQWKQWRARGYGELRRRGVDRAFAWNTGKSARGVWRLNRSPALAIALPTDFFAKLGLPMLQEVC